MQTDQPYTGVQINKELADAITASISSINLEATALTGILNPKLADSITDQILDLRCDVDRLLAGTHLESGPLVEALMQLTLEDYIDVLKHILNRESKV